MFPLIDENIKPNCLNDQLRNLMPSKGTWASASAWSLRTLENKDPICVHT